MRKFTLLAATAGAALLLAAGLYAGQPDEQTVTLATEYGLTKTQIASFDAQLCARLIRFGKVAQSRGRHLEAKRFFWKALLVDPTSKLAWSYYDQAVFFTLGQKIEDSPGLVGVPGLSDQPGAAPPAAERREDEGC